LLTSFDEATGNIPIHGVSMEVIHRHAEALRVPLRTIPLPWPCPNEVYVSRWRAAWDDAAREGIESIVFGDIYLSDVREFRERALAGTGLSPVFPLWGRDPGELANQIIVGGVRAVITAVDEERLGREWIGRRFDAKFLCELPPAIDPCGENGEFHTVVEL
jgi:uncharacterized protein (TIGR00290 family)